MMPMGRRAGAALLLAAGLAGSTAEAAPPRRVALVVAVGDYARLPEALDLAHARADAEELARVLREDGGYEVQEFLDRFATRSAVQSFLSDVLPGMVGPEDTLLVYFGGHGLGADFDDPRMLLYDADPADLAGTALAVAEVAERLRSLEVGALVVITDTAHPGALEGLALQGPHAKSWPELPSDTLLLSATSPRETVPDGVFVPVLTRALRGAADYDQDRQVTAAELVRLLVEQVPLQSGGAAHPVEAGGHGPNLVVAPVQGVPLPPGVLDAPTLSTRRKVGLGVLGGAALLAGGSTTAWLAGRPLAPVVFHEEAPGAGQDYGTTWDRYRTLWALHVGLAAASGVALLTGGALWLVPVDGGAAVGGTLSF